MEANSYPFAIGVFFLALIGLSTVFVVGYTADMPREVFVVFGRDMSLTLGLQAGFGAAFSYISAKVMLILISVMVSIAGGILSNLNADKFKHAAEKTDDAAIKIAAAPLKAVLLLAILVFWVRFLHFSTEGLVIVGGWVLFGVMLLETTDRVLLRKLKKVEDENAIAEIKNYQTVRLILFATMISTSAYSAGIAAERHAKRQEARVISERFDQPGIVFGAGDIGLLIYVPGELSETSMRGLLEIREPSAWYLLPFSGDPLELR
ncbi:hypothetical protein ACOTTU_17155 [Roseobacter sp. EG26]|uniref:hypothetical protein n=1 Tax=Roseobacter sp. EG26 TaxID=3412477 RepID=UPI003CE593B4